MFIRCQHFTILFRHLQCAVSGPHPKLLPKVFTLRCLKMPPPTLRGFATHIMNYYKILEAKPHFTTSQIKANYFRLSKKYHPDVNTSPNAAVLFNEISEAYEVLGNRIKRQEYDHGLSGAAPFKGAFREKVDVDYEDFLRHHQGPFRKRGKVPTGKTAIYDFDEFYRMHYGEALKSKKAKDVKKEEYIANELEATAKTKQRLLAFVVMLISMAILMVEINS